MTLSCGENHPANLNFMICLKASREETATHQGEKPAPPSPYLTYMCLKGGCARGGGNLGTLSIPREDWGSLGKMRGITTTTHHHHHLLSRVIHQDLGASTVNLRGSSRHGLSAPLMAAGRCPISMEHFEKCIIRKVMCVYLFSCIVCTCMYLPFLRVLLSKSP